MINFMVSRYNGDVSWVGQYSLSMILYDRSDHPIPGSNIVPNLGSDISDKLHYIITNYSNLPPVAIYTKHNLLEKYISKEEFDKVRDNSFFTPLLTMNHRTYNDDEGKPVCYYQNGIYWEVNNLWYLGSNPCKFDPKEVMETIGIANLEYVPFAPGSNYILTAADIRKHPVEFYIKLYNYLTWAVYPGEAQIIERGMYTIWR